MKRYKIRKEQLERVVESFVTENAKVSEKESLNEVDPMTATAGVGAILAAAGGMTALETYIDKLPKGHKLRNASVT